LKEPSFGNLDEVDVVAALERFQRRRRMKKTGVFQSMEPLA
jgi:hypothetical protein